jgi:hypothetical protein
MGPTGPLGDEGGEGAHVPGPPPIQVLGRDSGLAVPDHGNRAASIQECPAPLGHASRAAVGADSGAVRLVPLRPQRAGARRSFGGDRPRAADVASQLGLVVHDLRGPATALQAFARFLEQEAGTALAPVAAGFLEACQANAEVTGHLCDALALLDESGLRSRASLRDILAAAEGRLQKLLVRGQIGLKFPGEFPDREFDRRRLAFILEAVLVAIVQGSGVKSPSRLELSCREQGKNVVLTIAADAGAAGALDALAGRLCSRRPGGLSELGLVAALSDLGAEVAAPAPGLLDVFLPVVDAADWA